MPSRRAPGQAAKSAPAEPSDKLARYQAMRDFARTPEPSGATEPRGGTAGVPSKRRFVVQRHRARRRHYDLRFEIDGVLVSWAVPNGPTLDPKTRRLAVHVEDHPIEYMEFEGVIPAGEYGGGDVIVWDIGTWEPHETDDPAAAVAAGELHVDVTGHKLRGRLILVRSGREDKQWLLLHKDDDDAVPGWDPEDHPRSVLSGRTNDEVKADPDRMWRSDLPPAQASVWLRPEPETAQIPGPAPEELAALDGLGRSGSWPVFGRLLKLTNLDKDMFPGRDGQPPVTKRELIRYAAVIAPVILPYLAGRPLNMHRFPGGAG
jgi:bifunctional non-homologous end joining protein LigD